MTCFANRLLRATVCGFVIFLVSGFPSSCSAQPTKTSNAEAWSGTSSIRDHPPPYHIFVNDTAKPLEKTVRFKGRTFLILGCGAIARGILPLILRHVDIKTEQITVLTHPRDRRDIERDERLKGIRVVYGILTPDEKESKSLLESTGVDEGDFVLNLTADVDANMIMRFALSRGILYFDTTTDSFDVEDMLDADGNADWGDPTIHWSYTTYFLREGLLDLKSEFGPNASTAVSSHGANPGMVSHFVKQALVNMAAAADILLGNGPKTRREWSTLAQTLDVRAIQISEYDSQYRRQRRKFDEFVSTWSVDAFMTEASVYAEVGWGTHEEKIPVDGRLPTRGTNVTMILDKPGGHVFLRSWSPLRGPFYGMNMPHTESTSISHYLSLWDEGGELIYRPSTMFVYRPCDDCLLSVLEQMANSPERYEPDIRTIMKPEEIVEGEDELGVLIGSGKYGAYWYGSQLTAKRAHELVPGSQATTLQVTASAMAGIMWVLQNPRRGVMEPDELPYRSILDMLEPYVAPIVGEFSSWTPGKDTLDEEFCFESEGERYLLWLFDTNGQAETCPNMMEGERDPWQFHKIRV